MSLKIITKNFFFGFLASFSLLILYFLILTLANSFSHAISQFSEMWYWILILVAGFGLQVGLYTFIREKLKTASGRVLAVSGGISTGSMVVCCIHHLVDVLPIMGLAAASLFLIKYQTLFLVIGILSNLIGITIMLEIIQKRKLIEVPSIFKRILIYDMGRIKKAVIGFSLILLLAIFFLINNSGKTPTESLKIINLSSKTDTQSGVSFEVASLNFSFNNPVQFEIKIDTHSGSLDFDLAKVSVLEDDKGKEYLSSGWQGAGTGGHHRTGVLSFSKLENQPKSIKLIIEDIPSQPRIFEWEVK